MLFIELCNLLNFDSNLILMMFFIWEVGMLEIITPTERLFPNIACLTGCIINIVDLVI